MHQQQEDTIGSNCAAAPASLAAEKLALLAMVRAAIVARAGSASVLAIASPSNAQAAGGTGAAASDEPGASPASGVAPPAAVPAAQHCGACSAGTHSQIIEVVPGLQLPLLVVGEVAGLLAQAREAWRMSQPGQHA